jgi:hypothetical protein
MQINKRTLKGKLWCNDVAYDVELQVPVGLVSYATDDSDCHYSGDIRCVKLSKCSTHDERRMSRFTPREEELIARFHHAWSSTMGRK